MARVAEGVAVGVGVTVAAAGCMVPGPDDTDDVALPTGCALLPRVAVGVGVGVALGVGVADAFRVGVAVCPEASTCSEASSGVAVACAGWMGAGLLNAIDAASSCATTE